MGGTVSTAVVSALARRDLRMYFSSPSGYVFITLFIFLSAAAAFWQDRFFLQNLANLDQLNGVFPYLLLFFIPALTMGVWSEEKKLGTDELLLTLPGTDLEVVLGKYLAVLGIYTASLVLSLSYVGVLFYLGAPDLGLMASNYLGYWLVGAALIAVGMLASLLTRNATVAFIAAGLFCAVLVVAGPAAAAVAPGLGRAVEALGVFLHFDDFAKGIVSLSAIVYFASVGAFFLYLNVLVLSRRHWPQSAGGYPMGLHHAVRGIAVAAALVSAGVLVTNRSIRVDATAEQLHSLSGETRRLLDELPADRPVFIQAFISPDVPEPFVQTRSNLISILEEIDVIAGPRVEVLIQDTEPFTDAAREARETFGIQPRPIRNVSTARSEVEEVFLGVAFTCGAEEQVIGFFDVGLPAEYELMRSIRVVAGTERKRVGVVATMANLFGGTNFQRNQFTPQWSVVTELRKQYDVVEISPEMAIGQDVDALLVPLPSSLQTDEQGFVADYIRSGKPALILVDPLPAVNPTLSPSEWVGDGNPFTYPPGQPRPGPRGNVREWIRNLGVDWEPTRIVWDAYNPHPELAHMPEDVVFLGAGNENPATFDAGDPMTARLQELVLLFPGSLQAVDDPRFEFQPLLRSGLVSGANGYFSLVRGTPFGPQVNPSPPRRQDDDDYIVAARIRSVGGDAAGAAEDDADDDRGRRHWRCGCRGRAGVRRRSGRRSRSVGAPAPSGTRSPSPTRRRRLGRMKLPRAPPGWSPEPRKRRPRRLHRGRLRKTPRREPRRLRTRRPPTTRAKRNRTRRPRPPAGLEPQRPGRNPRHPRKRRPRLPTRRPRTPPRAGPRTPPRVGRPSRPSRPSSRSPSLNPSNPAGRPRRRRRLRRHGLPPWSRRRSGLPDRLTRPTPRSRRSRRRSSPRGRLARPTPRSPPARPKPRIPARRLPGSPSRPPRTSRKRPTRSRKRPRRTADIRKRPTSSRKRPTSSRKRPTSSRKPTSPPRAPPSRRQPATSTSSSSPTSTSSASSSSRSASRRRAG